MLDSTNPSSVDHRHHDHETLKNEILSDIDRAAHFLPSQGPITVFIHHNTLHSFEHLPFDQAVLRGMELFGCHPYLPEEHYRQLLARGRIRTADLAAVLEEDMDERADDLVGFMGTRFNLRMSMLEHSLRFGTDSEIRWCIDESDALVKFRSEAEERTRTQYLESTRRWILKLGSSNFAGLDARTRSLMTAHLDQFGPDTPESWSKSKWESFTLHLLWRICQQGVHAIPAIAEPHVTALRYRDLLVTATGEDIDLVVNDLLIRFCSSFLDQGLSNWPLPGRSEGFFTCFINLYREATSLDRRLRSLPAELKRLQIEKQSALQSIEESLHLLGVSGEERGTYVLETLLALRGWAGMLRQMETNAEWTVHPAPAGTLVEYLAIRLVLERVALTDYFRQEGSIDEGLHRLRIRLKSRVPKRLCITSEQRAFLVFQLAQVRGWSISSLQNLSKSDWSRLVHEIETFSPIERRRVFHLAFERQYRNRALDAILAHSKRHRVVVHGAGRRVKGPIPLFQIVCCIDDREESFRRHLEEIEPTCETFGMAGFFGVAMYYRGATDAHYRPLCPIVVKPLHYVEEEPIEETTRVSQQLARARRVIGHAAHQFHRGSRTFVGGLLAGLFGSLASIPLVVRVLAPRFAASMRYRFGRLVLPPETVLKLERFSTDPGPNGDHRGYTVEEMTTIVESTLRTIGLTKDFARLVIFTGHGSSSLNNPLGAAYDCGACGGGRGGPNARAFAQMANDARVRVGLAERGIEISNEIYFQGAFHNTCNDRVDFYDLDHVPESHRTLLARSQQVINIAQQRNAHERCRRFETAPLSIKPAEALLHVETRSEDLSQTRPELGHATNALCYVGRREWSRGLFLDRRAFLTSYDSRQDDPHSSILAQLLQAVFPVCAGINLEYLFSNIDRMGYGCGTKLPHNVTSLLGIMDGAGSDLRTGLPVQMIEIHDPMRILFLIETTPEAMMSILDRYPLINQLAANEWIRLATIDPESNVIHQYRKGEFELYKPETEFLPVVGSSMEWYRGERDHVAFASIIPEALAEPEVVE